MSGADVQPLAEVPPPAEPKASAVAPAQPSIANLAAALAAAQGEIEGAGKGGWNPHFKSSYAALASVWDACRAPLSKHGIAVVQLPRVVDGRVCVRTTLAHKSGETISCSLSAKLSQDTPQAIGSAITYLRRYGLMAMVGIAPDDDDGEAAEGHSARSGNGGNGREKGSQRRAPAATPSPKPFKGKTPKQLEALMEAFTTTTQFDDPQFKEAVRAVEDNAECKRLMKRWEGLRSALNSPSQDAQPEPEEQRG